MAGALHKSMVWMGLREDDPRYAESRDLDVDTWDEGEDEEVVDESEYRAEVTPITRDRSVSRFTPAPAADLRRITTIHPRTYNEAKAIGECFRGGVPVIMNLTDMSDADAKRLVDFSAGLVFGLHGNIERVTNKVFLLSPAHVEVTGEPVGQVKAVFNQS
ncbi:cell division protein SepF [Quadrisphaera setariae]|uniref:Cell division protein SepF n=1 Tax=Quadrisphaera setariae TaxID=2593304 RepID=A0A5C8ZEZ0_9ACTN|nr:cell division protein SepF [Quadrisphaera setariae]